MEFNFKKRLLLALIMILVSCEQAFADEVSCSGAPAWQNGSEYWAGSLVAYNDNKYEAKWWVNATPGQHAAWQNLGSCVAGASNQPAVAEVDCTGLNKWVSQAYSGGAIVQHNWKQYKAKYWVDGTPGQSSVWEEVGACDDISKAGLTYHTCDSSNMLWRANKLYSKDYSVAYRNGVYKANHPTYGHAPNPNDGSTVGWRRVSTCSDLGSNKLPVAKHNGYYEAFDPDWVTAGLKDFGGDWKGYPTIQFSSAGSNDPDGNVVAYHWNFGDGNTSSQANPGHSYNKPGTYTVTLRIKDNSGASTSVQTEARVGERIIGYFASNWGNHTAKVLDENGTAGRITHILYAFGNVNANGLCEMGSAENANIVRTYPDVDPIGQPPHIDNGFAVKGRFKQLMRLKRKHPHLRILWSFGGWTWSNNFGLASATNASRKAFAQSCHDLVFDDRWAGLFDGIDIDWEYPGYCRGDSDGVCDQSPQNAFPLLIKELRAKFGDKLVTAAIGAGQDKLDKANYVSAVQDLDFLMPMTYDFFGPWGDLATGPTAPHSALSSWPELANMPNPDQPDGSPGVRDTYYAKHTLQYFLDAGVPRHKLLLGIPFYGKGWSGVTQKEPGGTATGAGTKSGLYRDLIDSCPPNGFVGDTLYGHCGNEWWSYDTPYSLIKKMNYVDREGLGGAFFWDFAGDTDDAELVKGLRQAQWYQKFYRIYGKNVVVDFIDPEVPLPDWVDTE